MIQSIVILMSQSKRIVRQSCIWNCMIEASCLYAFFPLEKVSSSSLIFCNLSTLLGIASSREKNAPIKRGMATPARFSKDLITPCISWFPPKIPPKEAIMGITYQRIPHITLAPIARSCPLGLEIKALFPSLLIIKNVRKGSTFLML